MNIKLLVVPNEGKQVILTPDTPEEIGILKLFNEPNIRIFTDVSFAVERCRGGYWREYESSTSVVLLLEPINKDKVE